MHKHDKNQNLTNTLCRLCQSNTPETVEHLFNCPALRDEQNDIRQGIDETLKKWSVPYTALGHLRTQKSLDQDAPEETVQKSKILNTLKRKNATAG